MPTQMIPNPTHAFPPSQGPATGPDAQEAAYVELPNQDTVALPVGTLVSLKVTNNIVGVVRAPHTGATEPPYGWVVANQAPIGGIATVATDGIVQGIADNAVTAGDWLIAPSATDGRTKDSGVTSVTATDTISGTVIGYALTTQATLGALFWLAIQKC